MVLYGLVKILKLKSKPLMNGRGYGVRNGRGYGVMWHCAQNRVRHCAQNRVRHCALIILCCLAEGSKAIVKFGKSCENWSKL